MGETKAVKAQILLVDDNVEFLDSTRDVLEDEGYGVATATNGEDAVNMTEKAHFDVILMDIKMPGMNGVESFFKMKEKNPNIRVILFTAYSLEDLIRRTREGGAWEVLAKPLDMERLFESIEAAMKSGAGGCILLADDDKGFCDNLVDTLTQAGFRVATAFDGNEAVTMAQGKSFDVLLLDMKLPQLNGLEVYRRVKQYQPNLVTIIITGYAEEMGELITQALNENAYTCLRKPLEMGELFGLLKEICSRKSKGTVRKHSKRGP